MDLPRPRLVDPKPDLPPVTDFKLRMWSYDIAREQCPTLDHLRRFAELTESAGYNALGLYMEHRFAFECTPWAHGVGCVTPEMVRTLQEEYPRIQFIPFLNLLGHCEGFLYTEYGKRFREERFKGLQACPSNEAFSRLCGSIVNEAMAIFQSDLIHLGGDETKQLGTCPECVSRMAAKFSGSNDPKAELYGSHFGPLCHRVLEEGRRPALWGDMLLDHPLASEWIPQETLVFDWQYRGGLRDSAPRLQALGYEVVGCPTLHTYNAAWMHLPESEANIRQVALDASELELYGVCLTTWECGLFGSYDTLFPAIRGAAGVFDAAAERQEPGTKAIWSQYSENDLFGGSWASMMGESLQSCGDLFAFSGIRSSLKCRFLLYCNPFLLWMHHADELCGAPGQVSLETVESALRVAQGDAEKGICTFVKSAIEFVRLAEEARNHYAEGRFSEAIGILAPTRMIFDDLALVARRTHERIGGSLADIERCRVAKEHIEKVLLRIRKYGDGSLGYPPAFEILTHPKFMPHDQGSWWLINSWANE